MLFARFVACRIDRPEEEGTETHEGRQREDCYHAALIAPKKRGLKLAGSILGAVAIVKPH